eukprot:TRINITY_DN4759_c0_g1_i1.p1 TRINITY_DN4759_c0_g1~~TRINITY_DN4759_c0_g1_i1.p1  ORF type:complete len:342 (-),score=50.99 TRINITY_DN4759_c0_g1_i1:190-1215(-)
MCIRDRITECQVEGAMAGLEFAASQLLPNNSLLPQELRTQQQQGWCDACSLAESVACPLYQCTACGVQVHQHCYALLQPPALPESWLCDPCKQLPQNRAKFCALCPNPAGGAMRLACDAGRIKAVHAICGAACPEVRPRAPKKKGGVSTVGGLEDVPWTRWHKPCSLCANLHGVTLECAHATCTKRFHATCAKRHGASIVRDSSSSFSVLLFCSAHHESWPGQVISVGLEEPLRARKRTTTTTTTVPPPRVFTWPTLKLEPSEFCLRDHISAQELFRSEHAWRDSVLAAAKEGAGDNSKLYIVFEHWMRRRLEKANGLPLLREYCRDLHDKVVDKRKKLAH